MRLSLAVAAASASPVERSVATLGGRSRWSIESGTNKDRGSSRRFAVTKWQSARHAVDILPSPLVGVAVHDVDPIGQPQLSEYVLDGG
jgi:hypothetical protein